MKVVYEFDPFELTGVDQPSSDSATRDALDEIADYVRTEILQYVGEGKSPVAGGSWKKSLSEEYKKIKEKISGTGFANMELTGEMLDALEAKVTSDGKIVVGWFGGKEADKADGHNNFSGKSNLPLRQSIPNNGETFRSDIVSGMRDIAQAFMDEK